ncbi:MAG: transcriptional regulator [Candidatus Woesearchaeota archaeon]
MKMLPQEIEVWYLIPAIRKELAISLSRNGIKQKDISAMLGVTPSAVSQYIKQKRGNESLREDYKKKIDEAALELIEGKPLIPIMKRLSKEAWQQGILCDMHRKYDKGLPEKCRLC